MKKLSAEARRRSMVVARRRAGRSARCASVRAKRARRTEWKQFDRANKRWVSAPVIFSLEDEQSRLAVVQFLRSVREAALSSDPRVVRINFARTRRMIAPATLLFLAELDRINAIRPGRIRCTPPQDDVVAQVLQHVGIFRHLGFASRCKVTADNVVHWEAYSGSHVDGSAVGLALKKYSNLFSTPVNKKLYGGLTEAMTNTKHWAYEEPRGDGYDDVLQNWWMFTQYQPDTGHLTVAICDLGIGIPRSLPRRPGWREAMQVFMFLGRWMRDDDASRIKAAFVVGASRTRQANRGKGLMEIRSVLDGLQGRIHIHSNSGHYVYDGAKHAEVKCKSFSRQASILGTLILWTVPVKDGQAL